MPPPFRKLYPSHLNARTDVVTYLCTDTLRGLHQLHISRPNFILCEDAPSASLRYIGFFTSYLKMETLLEGKHAGQTVDDSVLGVESRVPLRISTSDIIPAGSGILVEGQIQGNEEIFRVTQTLVTVQYVNPITS